MVLKKIDNRIRVMIENGVTLGHRTLFAIVGDKARDQVVLLHHMLSKATVKARPTVLWCYKKELGFSSHRKKRMKKLQKKITSGKLNVNEDDPFELFVASTSIRYCYYYETHRILGNTYGMCVLQDFEALTPNLLARSVETVEGGGIIVILLQSVNSLKQLYTLNMDVHSRYRTEAHADIIGRFNERFILSLASCSRCVVLDDSLKVLPLSSHILDVVSVVPSEKKVSKEEVELKELKENLQDTQPVGVLVNLCKTKDQAKALLKFVEAISEKSLRVTATLTAARGRGKSAALGLSIAAAVAFGYSNIFVTSPSPENLKTLFEFVFKGFDVLEYQEHIDYELIQSTNPEFNKAVVRVNVFREHRQTIQYIHPGDAVKLSQAELVVIDEAAAIPLPMVKSLLGPYLVFMASTVNGYEGTGRSLSLKLIQQLRNQNKPEGKDTSTAVSARKLHEATLNESIRYKSGDAVEKWLNQLLCLEADTVPMINSGCPLPQDCELYYINRDTLFCYHAASEAFLQRLMALYVSSHYKNSPNDLQMMSDAPAHHLFCLLPPVDPQTTKLPEVLCVIQVCLEGEISKGSIEEGLRRGMRAAGDLIPWTVAQQFQDQEFPGLSGARIVRIATHPNYQGMGYGSRALELLAQYYEGRLPNISETENIVTEANNVAEDEGELGLLEEEIAPRKNLPPLLLTLSERKPEPLQYLGTSFGLTHSLLKFWTRAGYSPVYVRQTPNELTGEYSSVMLKALEGSGDSSWQQEFWEDFRKRFMSLLGMAFRSFSPTFSLAVITNKARKIAKKDLNKQELDCFVSGYDIKRLELYSQNMADYHLILDLIPALSRLYFLQRCGDLHLSPAQGAILLGMGLQQKTADDVAKELNVETTQLLGLFNRLIRKFVQYLKEVVSREIEKQISKPTTDLDSMRPLKKTLDEELSTAEKELSKQQQLELQRLKGMKLEEYAIKGSEEDWDQALSKNPQGIVSVKSATKRLLASEVEETSYKREKKKKKMKKGKHS